MDLPSRRYRSRKSLGTRINKIRYTVSKTENTSIPSVVGNNAVNTESFVKNAVSTDYLTFGSVDSTTYSTSAYLPSGETNQRVPAPLTDTIYWTQVVEGLVELHTSGIHGDGELEDIQNVSVEPDGLSFDSTTSDARIYLTGRLDIPRSRKIYGTWESDYDIPVKLIYWEETPTYFVESAYRADGITHLDLSNTSHTLSVGDLVTVTKTTDDFDGLYRVVETKSDYVSLTSYTTRYTLTVDDSTYDVDTKTATFTMNGENTTSTIIKANDLVVVSSVSGYESLAGPHRILTVDDTTTAGTIVITFQGLYTADVDDFYNTSTITVYKGTDTDTINQQNFSPLGLVSEDIYHYIQLKDRTVWGADGYTFPITKALVANSVVTITTAYAHYANIGDLITVTGLDASTGQSGFFDVSNKTITNINTSANTINYATYSGFPPFPGNSYGPTTNTSGALAVTQNQYIPKQYAVYAELPAGQNVKKLTSAKVFEVIGEPSTIKNYYTISNIDTTVPQNSIVTLTNTAPDATQITLKFNDATIAAELDGAYTVISTSASNVEFDATYGLSRSVNSYSQATTGIATVLIGRRHYEVTPDGIVFYDRNGGIDTRLGSETQDEITIGNASIDVNGVGSFADVYTGSLYATQPSSFEADTTFNSNVAFNANATFNSAVKIFSTVANTSYELYGSADTARYHVISNSAANTPYTQTSTISYYAVDILNRYARGLIYSVNYGPMLDDNVKTATADRYTWAAGTFILEPNRNYLFNISFGNMRVANDSNVDSRVEFIAGTDSTALANYALNTMTATNIVYVRQSVNFEATYTGPIPPMTFEYTSTSTSITGGMNTFAIQSGVEIYWQLRFTYNSTAARSDLVFREADSLMQGKYGVSIYDMGPAVLSQIGSTIGGENKWLSTGTFVGGGGSAPAPTVKSGRDAADALASAYYDNFGIGDNGTSDPYANEQSIYQGNPGTSSGTKKSHVTFPAISTIVGSTIYNDADFTITKIELYLKNRHSYLSGGLSAKIGYTSDGSIGGSAPPNAESAYSPISTNFSKGEGKWIELPSAWWSAIKSAGTWGILLGITSTAGTDTYDSTTSNYGYFDGALQSLPPRVRVSYTYTP